MGLLQFIQNLAQIGAEVSVRRSPIEALPGDDKLVKRRELLLEQIKLQYTGHLELYKSLRSDVLQHIQFQHQMLTVTIAAAGGLMAATPFIVNTGNSYMFLVASLLFHSLLWSQLRYFMVSSKLSSHIKEVSQRMRECVLAIAPEAGTGVSDMLRWESRSAGSLHPQSIFLLPIEFSRYLIPLLGAVVSFFSYILTQHDRVGVIVAAGFAEATLVAYSLTMLWWARRTHLKSLDGD